MAIASGIGARAFLDTYNITGQTARMDEMSASVAQFDKTTINLSAMRRLDGRRDGALGTTCHFDDDTDQSFDALTVFPAAQADRLLTYAHRATLGAAAFCCIGRQTNLDFNRPTDGDLLLAARVAGNGYGTEMGHLLTAGVATSTGTEALAGFDDQGGGGAATDFGLQAYLHVFDFTGTSVDIVIQDSDDDAATDPYTDVTGAAFTTVTGPTFERIQTARTENVKEWLRVDLDGTYTDLDFAVVVVPNRLSLVAF